jgi:hypothetical protein
MADNDRILNNVEAAAILGCKPGVLVRLRQTGEVPFVSYSRDGYRYSQRALEQVKQQRLHPSKKAA